MSDDDRHLLACIELAEQAAGRGKDEQDHGTEGKLARLDAEVERKQGQRNLARGQADLRQRTGEAHPVQKAEVRAHG